VEPGLEPEDVLEMDPERVWPRRHRVLLLLHIQGSGEFGFAFLLDPARLVNDVFLRVLCVG
jgi:hypothetical protein